MSATAVTRTPAADAPLPLVLAGPILRRLMPDRLAIWLALSAPVNARLSLDADDGVSRCHVLSPGDAGCRHLAAGTHEAVWDGRDASGRAMSAGCYFARLEAQWKAETVRMSLVR